MEVKSFAKYLGVTFDRRLTRGKHISDIRAEAENKGFIIKRLSNMVTGVNQKIMLTLYKTIVRPVIEYGSEVWGDASKTQLKKLETIEHRSLASRKEEVEKLFTKYNIPIEDKIMNSYEIDSENSKMMKKEMKRIDRGFAKR